MVSDQDDYFIKGIIFLTGDTFCGYVSFHSSRDKVNLTMPLYYVEKWN